MVLCVSHTQVAVPFLTTCQTVMPTVVVVHSLVAGNMTFTTCHSVKSERVSTVKFLKNTQCQPLTCVWLKISQTLSIMVLTALKSKVVWNLSTMYQQLLTATRLLVTLTWKVQKPSTPSKMIWLTNSGKLPNVNWQQVSTTRHQQKTSNSLVLVVRFHNTNSLVK